MCSPFLKNKPVPLYDTVLPYGTPLNCTEIVDSVAHTLSCTNCRACCAELAPQYLPQTKLQMRTPLNQIK